MARGTGNLSGDGGGRVTGSGQARTGIDFGTASIKLVRAVGGSRVERLTHVGAEDWEAPGRNAREDAGPSVPLDAAGSPRVALAAEALRRLLHRLGLSRRQLGLLAATAGGYEVSLREILLPQLTEAELRRALPYEARKQLDLEAMIDPLLDAQILARDVTANGDEHLQMRVLLAAVPRAARDFVLAVLDEFGLEPHVVDLEPLAALNELLARHPESSTGNGEALALLDVGGSRTALHLAGRAGGVLSRRVGDGMGACGPSGPEPVKVLEMATRIRETLTHFRGRHHQQVQQLYLAGGGALSPGCVEALGQGLRMRVAVLDPLDPLGRSARGWDEVAQSGPRFVTACGLCRWWDREDV